MANQINGSSRSSGETFERTVETAAKILTPKALRPERALNVSVADAVLVGLAHRLRENPKLKTKKLQSAHEQLLRKLRNERLYTEGTTDKDRVTKRIAYARQAYGAAS